MTFPDRRNISFAVLADSHKIGERNKVDCFGMFDTMWVWATPASRQCSIALGLRDIEAGRIPVAFWLRATKGKRLQLATGEIEVGEPTHSVITAQRIPLHIASIGRHEVGISLGKNPAGSSTFWIPLLVNLRDWPRQIVEPELSRLLSDPHTIKASRAVLVCEKCGTKYVFEAHLDPKSPLPHGSLAFPENGIFRCGKCGRVHHLKDLEGQVLSHLGQSAPGAVV